MNSRRRLAVALLLFTLPSAPLRAQKLDKDDKKFLDDVRPILLPDEEKTFKGLKDKADRQEFQKIFWARRDPDLDTPQNEFQAEYQKALAEADAQFKVAGLPGSRTDCGRVFILLGKPDEVKKEAPGESPAARSPETWTYRDRPNQKFAGGQAQISFDGECRLPPGARLGEQLDRLAADRVVHPNIGYRFDKDGRLTKLAELLPKPSPARSLLQQPRQDFSLISQTSFLKAQDGGSAAIGVVRGDAKGLALEGVGAGKSVKVVVCGQALGEDGKEAALVERKTTAEVQADGSFVASFRLGLKPGKYTLKAGALDEKSGKGSVASSTIEVPDFGTGELSLASVIVLRDVRDVRPGGDPDGPFAALELGSAILVPYATTTLTKADTPSFFYQAYDLKVDPASGKASGSANLAIFKAQPDAGADASAGGPPRYKPGAPVAQAPGQPIETAVAGSVVGPVPLASYEPGVYLVQIKVTDKLAKKDKVQEITIEVKP
jgi:GWxTD domain-containing protein